MGFKFLVISDIHYASDAEKTLGENELQGIYNPFFRMVAFFFRYFFWLRHPHAHNDKLLKFLEKAPQAEMVVGCGDYSNDAGNTGASFPAAFQSTQEVFRLIQERFGHTFISVAGDHEIGKIGLFGKKGGPRLASWEIIQKELNIKPFWHRQFGIWHFFGLNSFIISLPNIEKELLETQKETWEKLRKDYLKEFKAHLNILPASAKVILFSHDPTALSYLCEIPEIIDLLERKKIAITFVGHLHTPLVLKASYLLAGMPKINFLGHSIARMTESLSNARHWKDFNLILCPSMTGCQLAKDGGWIEVDLQDDGNYTLTHKHLAW